MNKNTLKNVQSAINLSKIKFLTNNISLCMIVIQVQLLKYQGGYHGN